MISLLKKNDLAVIVTQAHIYREGDCGCLGKVWAFEDQRNCRSDGWQYGLVLQQVACAFDYAMRRSSWMHVQELSNAISYAS